MRRRARPRPRRRRCNRVNDLPPGDVVVSDDEKRTLELLEAHHAFPGEYPVTVIVLNSDGITGALVAAIEDELAVTLAATACETRSSSGGKYLSHRLKVPCAAAADVIRLYARIRRVEGVVTVL